MLRHISAMAEIVEDFDAAVKFYEGLGLHVEIQGEGGYGIAHDMRGVLHFGVWDRANAAQMILGDASKAAEVPLGFTLSLEVDDVAADRSSMDAPLIGDVETMPWGQKVAHFRSPSGTICEISEMPGSRELETDVKAKA